jgi:peptidoglycan/LPS O-acetylase OafA/YrhL
MAQILSKTHFPALDGLRAAAILLVIPHNVSLLSDSTSLWARPISELTHSGWIGVQLFFVLSGFLITGGLLDSKESPYYYRSFISRRIARIFPLYYGVLLIAFVALPLLGSMPEAMRASKDHQLWLWTFLTNWAEPRGASVAGFGHFWSLAIEEQFYFLWPFLVQRVSTKQLLAICLVIAMVAFASRLAMVLAGASDQSLYMFTNCRMDALACGAIVAAALRIPHWRAYLVAHGRRMFTISCVVLLITAAATHGLYASDPICEVLGFSVLAMAFAGFVASGVVLDSSTHLPTKLLSAQAFKYIARYSYGMYVFHVPLNQFVFAPSFRKMFPQPSDLAIVGYIAVVTIVVFAIAALSYELFERRFLQLGRRFIPVAAEL